MNLLNKTSKLTKKSCIFNTLYSKDKSNRIQEWSIKVEHMGEYTDIICEYGMRGGKKITNVTQIKTGKNVGKSNETTHFEQGVKDAESKWNKKYKSGCRMEIDTTNDLEQQLDNLELTDSIFPMLAQEYKKHSAKVKFPCYIQPKLDGYRMIYNGSTKKCTSRTGKDFLILENSLIKEQLDKLGGDLAICSNKTNLILDGELYLHDPSFSFESYGVLRKQKELTDKEQKELDRIEYHIYDIVDFQCDFGKRKTIMRDLEVKINKLGLDKLKIVETIRCADEMEINKHHEEYVSRNYEGTMIRNAHGMYRCKFRSYDLLKNKDFEDHEYKIIGYTAETGNEIIWICQTEDGKQFHVQSKGTKEERREIYKEAEKYVGKQLWVQHFGITSDGIPRFPKTMRCGLESVRDTKY
jgi:ATP-dependent DNA ligase